MRNGDNPIVGAVQDEYPLPSYFVPDFTELRRRFVMPASRDDLQQKVGLGETLAVTLFHNLLSDIPGVVAFKTPVWPPTLGHTAPRYRIIRQNSVVGLREPVYGKDVACAIGDCAVQTIFMLLELVGY
jgi:hypothetical protein